MNICDELNDILYKHNIKLIFADIGSVGAISLPGVIALDNNLTGWDKIIKAVHEIAHQLTGTFYYKDSDPTLIAKYERTARLKEYSLLGLTKEYIDKIVFENCLSNNYEIAEYIGIPEEFLQQFFLDININM